jgi:hypothetical protein
MSTTFSNFTSDTTKVFTVEYEPSGALTFTNSNNQVVGTIADPAATVLGLVDPNPSGGGGGGSGSVRAT